jgi:UDP-N-acetylglucosamine--N-acetylmuramyl-(pentapeptide) pyrophosphoryl-undecaprenol N-acetylglucosamine transferase
VAARLLRKPLVIHEQNAIAGTTNRLLARIATRILTAFPGALTGAQVVGNPVRAEIAALPAPAERYRERGNQPLHLLILGGSLGARAINERTPEALAELPENVRPEVWHQAGKQHVEATAALYQRHNVTARVEPFIADMAKAYGWADIIVCRAGALTVSEIMAAGVAAVLVPFPHAIDDHQTANARVLMDQQAALLVPQAELTTERLATLLLKGMAERSKLATMAENARQLALAGAADTVADICVEVVRG